MVQWVNPAGRVHTHTRHYMQASDCRVWPEVASSPGRIFSNRAEGRKFGLVSIAGVIVRMRVNIC